MKNIQLLQVQKNELEKNVNQKTSTANLIISFQKISAHSQLQLYQ